MTILVTGAAGFIGSHVAKALLARGDKVIGLDNFTPYYDPVLKFARLKPLRDDKGFTFLEADICDREAMLALAAKHGDIDGIVHLAAQPGVKQSITDPYTYVETNVMGQVIMLELARRLPALKHFVYASSSSVYGGNRKLPFSVEDPVDHPISLYAATKRAGELMAETYVHIHKLKTTGLRYFTVYGPWGRPDMSPFIFAKAIHEGSTINLYHLGFIKRDFGYVDDIVAGTIAILDKPPEKPEQRLYNIGASKPEDILDVIELFEKALGKKAKIDLKPGEPGDMQETFADVSATMRDFDWKPKVTVAEGIPKFVEWFKAYHGL